MTIKMTKGAIIIITIIAILVLIVIAGVILYFLFRGTLGTQGVDNSVLTPEQQCNAVGLRWVDDKCLENRVCPEPFYDIGSVDGATGPYDFECGVPNNILSRIGSTITSDPNKFQIKALNVPGDNFTSPEEVTSFWKILGFKGSEIITGGGPDADGCPDVPCSEGRGFYFTANNGTDCLYFQAFNTQYNAHIQPSGQGISYNIDKNSWRNLSQCNADACDKAYCTVPVTPNRGSTFFVANLR